MSAAVYAGSTVKTPVLVPPSKETSPQADQVSGSPLDEARPNAAPQRKKREMPALALVVTLLGLALLLMVPAIIVLSRMQS